MVVGRTGLLQIQLTLLLSRIAARNILLMTLERILFLGHLPLQTKNAGCKLALFGMVSPSYIRRHAFIVWLVIHDRLATQDKLLKWDFINSMSCVLCQANVEDRNHMFFSCQFTAGIWMRILRLFGNSRMLRNWENEFLWVVGTKGKSLSYITKRIVWGATIYHLLRQRNSRIHENVYSSVEAIFHLIYNDVRLRVSGL